MRFSVLVRFWLTAKSTPPALRWVEETACAERAMSKVLAHARQLIQPGRWARLSRADRTKWEHFEASSCPQSHAPHVLRPSDFEHITSWRFPAVLHNLQETWSPPKTWQLATLTSAFGDRTFAFGDTDDADPVLFSLGEYAQYIALDAEADRNPLYLFDPAFDMSAPEVLQMYHAPPPFDDDPMSGMSLDDRPDWRWLLVGATRSGSTLHKDPLETSAWNSLLQGRKRWVLIHPDAWTNLCLVAQQGVVVPRLGNCRGIEGLDGRGDLFGWFMETWPQLREELSYNHALSREAVLASSQQESDRYIARGWYEFDQLPGETVFVPRGWLHAVVNLETSVAVTQNLCGRFDLDPVVREMRRRAPEAALKWERTLADLPEDSWWGAAWRAL